MKYGKLLVLLAATAGLIAMSSTADARAGRVLEVPNGVTFNCLLCHTDAVGNGPRNAFGAQVEDMGLDGVGDISTQKVVWANIADLDADGDGFTNGQELGDPNGAWEIGQDDPETDNVGDPNDADDFPEGDVGGGGGDDGGTEDEGCAVAPGQVGSSGLLLALVGLFWVMRRRS